ncbi:MAG TPA: helix-hairpin-helix domain-containing protein, partial [Cyclobacteriaceae bacterium]|nr:helix-hairpin-helix domain-containing protein [Cyclobacteriaceae bacterium]
MKAIAFICSLLLFFCSQAQDYPREDFNPEKLSDEIFPIQDRDLNYEELYENLAQLMSRPLDLNTISREQLRALMVMGEEEINSFIRFRDENGPLLSVYELQAVPGWSRVTFDKIIPFVKVRDSQSRFDRSILHRITKQENAYLLLRVERGFEVREGYKKENDSLHRYLGSPEKFYVRYRVARTNDFSVGFTFEKDQGEPMTWSPPDKQYGFDYLSFHAQILNKGKLQNLIIGDFQTQFGQGLILGSVFGFGKNSETITTVRRSNLGFLPYTSLNETLFFRGMAGSITLSK